MVFIRLFIKKLLGSTSGPDVGVMLDDHRLASHRL